MPTVEVVSGQGLYSIPQAALQWMLERGSKYVRSHQINSTPVTEKLALITSIPRHDPILVAMIKAHSWPGIEELQIRTITARRYYVWTDEDGTEEVLTEEEIPWVNLEEEGDKNA